MNSKQVNETVNRLMSFMNDVNDCNLRTILANMQKMNDCLAEKIRIYEEHLTVLTGRKRPELSDSDKHRLAQKGKALNDFLPAAVEPTWAQGTIRNWYNQLVGTKYDSTGSPNQRKRGRKPVSYDVRIHWSDDQETTAHHAADELPDGKFIRAIITECLDKMIFTSEAQLRIAVRDYLEYWNHYRPHAGLGGTMVKPYPQDMDAPVVRGC